MSDDAEAMDDEFDTTATWTLEAVQDLGPEYAVPAACQGSGGPAALAWLVDHLRMNEDLPFLDVGAGLGGPAELAARTSGAAPLLVEPAEAACTAAVRLFGRSVLVGDGAALPIASGSFEVAWSLGVLCTVADKQTHLAEIVRVLGPGGRLGLLVYERTVDRLPDPPEGNDFPDEHEVAGLLARVGLRVTDETLLTDLPAVPEKWQARADRVDEWIARQHAGEPAWQRAHDQRESLGSLIDSGLVVGRMLTAYVGTERE